MAKFQEESEVCDNRVWMEKGFERAEFDWLSSTIYRVYHITSDHFTKLSREF